MLCFDYGERGMRRPRVPFRVAAARVSPGRRQLPAAGKRKAPAPEEGSEVKRVFGNGQNGSRQRSYIYNLCKHSTSSASARGGAGTGGRWLSAELILRFRIRQPAPQGSDWVSECAVPGAAGRYPLVQQRRMHRLQKCSVDEGTRYRRALAPNLVTPARGTDVTPVRARRSSAHCGGTAGPAQR